MSQITVKSTKEIRAIYPDIAVTNKFKRKLDEVFQHGYSFDIAIAEPFKCFRSKTTGNQYRMKLIYKGMSVFGSRTKVITSHVSMDQINANPGIYRNVSTVSTCKYKMGNDDKGPWIEQFSCERDQDDKLGWADICRMAGKLLKDEFVHVEECSKCHGTGIIPEFMWYADGICFQCMGMGKWYEVSEKTKA